MRNDEKIDINLATEGTSENLSEEELAQQNYETYSDILILLNI